MGRDLHSTPDPFISRFIMSGGPFKAGVYVVIRELQSYKRIRICIEKIIRSLERNQLKSWMSFCFRGVFVGLKVVAYNDVCWQNRKGSPMRPQYFLSLNE